MTNIYSRDLEIDLEITSKLAEKAARYSAEEIACADPQELRVLLTCHELLARKLVTYAKMKAGGARREEPAPRVVVVSSVTIVNLSALLTSAFHAWELQRMFTPKPFLVPIDTATSLYVRAVTDGYFEVSAGITHADEPVYRVNQVVDLVNALYMMEGRYWRVPIDGLIRALISFAESGKH